MRRCLPVDCGVVSWHYGRWSLHLRIVLQMRVLLLILLVLLVTRHCRKLWLLRVVGHCCSRYLSRSVRDVRQYEGHCRSNRKCRAPYVTKEESAAILQTQEGQTREAPVAKLRQLPASFPVSVLLIGLQALLSHHRHPHIFNMVDQIDLGLGLKRCHRCVQQKLDNVCDGIQQCAQRTV